MTWDQPAVIIAIVAALISIGSAIANFYTGRKGREASKELAIWSSYTERLRTASGIIDTMRDSVFSLHLQLATVEKLAEFDLKNKLNSVERALKPALDSDAELITLLGSTFIYITQLRQDVPSVQDFRHVVHSAIFNIRREGFDLSTSEKVDFVYEMLARMARAAADQRAARDLLLENLSEVSTALHKRMN